MPCTAADPPHWCCLSDCWCSAQASTTNNALLLQLQFLLIALCMQPACNDKQTSQQSWSRLCRPLSIKPSQTHIGMHCLCTSLQQHSIIFTHCSHTCCFLQLRVLLPGVCKQSRLIAKHRCGMQVYPIALRRLHQGSMSTPPPSPPP